MTEAVLPQIQTHWMYWDMKLRNGFATILSAPELVKTPVQGQNN